MLRKGIYAVPTDRWYIERTVWLIAGIVLLTSTLLAVLVNPLWIFAVIATGLVSINVALTGFCPSATHSACSVSRQGSERARRHAGTFISCRPTAGISNVASTSRSASMSSSRPSCSWRIAHGGACSPPSSAPRWSRFRNWSLHPGQYIVLDRCRTAAESGRACFSPCRRSSQTRLMRSRVDCNKRTAAHRTQSNAFMSVRRKSDAPDVRRPTSSQ